MFYVILQQRYSKRPVNVAPAQLMEHNSDCENKNNFNNDCELTGNPLECPFDVTDDDIKNSPLYQVLKAKEICGRDYENCFNPMSVKDARFVVLNCCTNVVCAMLFTLACNMLSLSLSSFQYNFVLGVYCHW